MDNVTIRKTILNSIAWVLFVGTAQAQQTASGDSSRIDIGGRFSISNPAEGGWRAVDSAGSFSKAIEPEGHSLVLTATTGPSGISREDIFRLRGPDAANLLVKLVSGFVQRAWKTHAAGTNGDRFEAIDVANETGGQYSIGKFICAYSRIRVRDRGAMLDGIPSQMRYIAYSCIEFPDMAVAAHVSYSERGREQDLSDEAIAEGERFARSLQRQP